MKNNSQEVEQILFDIMRHFNFRRNYEVAQYFKVTPQTLSGWIKNGEIPAKHLIKYNNEIKEQSNQQNPSEFKDNVEKVGLFKESKNQNKISFKELKNYFVKNIFILIGLPLIIISSMSIYVFFIAEPVYTSISKVLPISEDGSSSNSFSGMAAQLGISIPLSIGGTVPWDEVYPEIILSSNMLSEMLTQEYQTKKYGNESLKFILIKENHLYNYPKNEQENRAIFELQKMIKISKERLSPIVTIMVEAFEPIFASELSKNLIKKSSKIQRELKTNRVKEKRLFIEERLVTVSRELKLMEKELRKFREFNRNLSSSPTLEMQVQEMGREIDLHQSLYVTLKTQYEKAKIDEIERNDMVQQIDGPSIPTKLTRPLRTLNILLSIFFGIFISIFTVYFKENYFHSSSL